MSFETQKFITEKLLERDGVLPPHMGVRRWTCLTRQKDDPKVMSFLLEQSPGAQKLRGLAYTALTLQKHLTKWGSM